MGQADPSPFHAIRQAPAPNRRSVHGSRKARPFGSGVDDVNRGNRACRLFACIAAGQSQQTVAGQRHLEIAKDDPLRVSIDGIGRRPLKQSDGFQPEPWSRCSSSADEKRHTPDLAIRISRQRQRAKPFRRLDKLVVSARCRPSCARCRQARSGDAREPARRERHRRCRHREQIPARPERSSSPQPDACPHRAAPRQES